MGEGKNRALVLALAAAIAASASSASADLVLGAVELVRSDGLDIDVPGYSVPSFVHWDSDTLPDLVVGQGSGLDTAKVRVYLNEGTSFRPRFTTYSFVQSGGVDLEFPGGG
jgi:hypothetical protein